MIPRYVILSTLFIPTKHRQQRGALGTICVEFELFIMWQQNVCLTICCLLLNCVVVICPMSRFIPVHITLNANICLVLSIPANMWIHKYTVINGAIHIQCPEKRLFFSKLKHHKTIQNIERGYFPSINQLV